MLVIDFLLGEDPSKWLFNGCSQDVWFPNNPRGKKRFFSSSKFTNMFWMNLNLLFGLVTGWQVGCPGSLKWEPCFLYIYLDTWTNTCTKYCTYPHSRHCLDQINIYLLRISKQASRHKMQVCVRVFCSNTYSWVSSMENKIRYMYDGQKVIWNGPNLCSM